MMMEKLDVNTIGKDEAIYLLETEFSNIVEPIYDCSMNSTPFLDFIYSFQADLRGVDQSDMDFINANYIGCTDPVVEGELLNLEEWLYDAIEQGDIYLVDHGEKRRLFIHEGEIFSLPERYWELYWDLARISEGY